MSLLTLTNVETYYGPIMAIRGISLEVREGEISVLLGANGAGKTTVLKTISGAMEPQKGRIIFAGEEIQGQDPDKTARLGIGHVPEGREVFPFLSVEENLQMGAYTRRDNEISADIERVYDYFPVLADKKKQQAAFLSGGQQQMLAIGRALMCNPRLLLLDEPSLGLAPLIVEQVLDLIKKLRDEGVSIFLVEQNVAGALAISDRAYMMAAGVIVSDGSAEDIRQSGTMAESYLGGH